MELTKTKYIQTEVGLTPEDWKITTLGESVLFLDNLRKPIKSSDREKMKGIYPYYDASGIIDYVNSYIFDDELILLGEDGENILSRNLPLAFIVKGKIWVNNHAHVLKPNDDFDIYYLSEFLESLDYTLLNSGTAQPKLNQKTCREIKILKPPLPEQKAIAEVLSDVDWLIQVTEQKLAKKRAIKKGAMQKLLTPKEDWEVKKLGEVGEIATGTTPPTRDLDNYGKDFCFVSPADLGTAKYISKTEKNLSIKGFNLSRKFPKNSILFTCIGSTIGKMGIASIELTSNQQINAIFPNENYNSEYLYYQLSLIAKKIRMKASEQAVPMINKTEFAQIFISIPKLKEQNRIAIILSDMDKEIELIEQQIAKYKTLKQGLMQELLTGKTRLTV